MLADYLKARAGASVHVLAIQPESLGMAEALSRSVEQAVEDVAALLSDSVVPRVLKWG